MNILDTFYILFESDSREVKKGAQDAKKTTDDLNKSLKATDQVSGKVGNEFVRLVQSAGGMLAAAFSVGAIVSATMAAANYADGLGELADAIDGNVSELDVWGRAVQLSGGTAEGFQGTVKTMTAALADFATKGTSRAAPFFQDLGIKMVDAQGKARNFMDLLPEIADSFQGLSKAESFGIGQKMGLDQGTIMLLQQGRREVDIMIAKQKELGAVTEKDAAIAAKFNDQWDMTAMAFRSLFVQVSSSVLPAMTAVMEAFEKVGTFFRKHSDFITGILIALGAAVLYFVVPPLVAAGAAALVAFAPFLLMGAVIAGVATAFALLYDDVMNFVDGNDSLIGQIVEKFPIIGEIATGIKDAFLAMFDSVAWIFETMASLIQISVALWAMLFGAIGEHVGGFISESKFIQDAIEIIKLAFQLMGAVVGVIFDGMSSKVKEFIGFVKEMAGWVTDKISGLKNILGIGGEVKVSGLEQGKNQLALAANSPISSQSSNSIATSSQNRSTSVNVGTVNVQTQATDADGISKSIGSSMNDQMKRAANSFDDGVLA
jgi:hypothetical protein